MRVRLFLWLGVRIDEYLRISGGGSADSISRANIGAGLRTPQISGILERLKLV